MAVAELATKISFIGNLKPLDNLNRGLTSAVGSIAKVGSILTVATVALNGFLANTLAGADAQVQLSRSTGVSMEAIQEWGYVASVNGSSADALERSITNLSKKIGEASTQGSDDFSRLGISVRDSMGHVKSADTILKELAVRFKQLNLSKEEQSSYLEKLGIDESMIQTLNLSSDALQNLQNKAKNLGVVTKADGDQIASFNDSLTTLKYGVDAVQKRLAIAFAPQLKDLSDGFTDLLVANKSVINKGLKKFFMMINSGLGAIFKFGRLLYDMIDNTLGIKNALMLAGGAMLYLNRAMLANPITWIIAGIGTLIMLYDDLEMAMRGGKSVIADWFKEWFNLDIGEVISGLNDDLNNFYKYLEDTYSETATFWSGVGNSIAGFYKNIETTATTIITSVKDKFTSMTTYIKGLIENIVNFFKPVINMLNKVKNFKMPSMKSLNPFSGDDKKKDSKSHWYNPTSWWGSDEPKKVATSHIQTSSSSQQHNNINIEIKTDNPQMAGQSVANELQGVLNNANTTFNRSGGI